MARGGKAVALAVVLHCAFVAVNGVQLPLQPQTQAGQVSGKASFNVNNDIVVFPASVDVDPTPPRSSSEADDDDDDDDGLGPSKLLSGSAINTGNPLADMLLASNLGYMMNKLQGLKPAMPWRDAVKSTLNVAGAKYVGGKAEGALGNFLGKAGLPLGQLGQSDQEKLEQAAAAEAAKAENAGRESKDNSKGPFQALASLVGQNQNKATQKTAQNAVDPSKQESQQREAAEEQKRAEETQKAQDKQKEEAKQQAEQQKRDAAKQEAQKKEDEKKEKEQQAKADDQAVKDGADKAEDKKEEKKEENKAEEKDAAAGGGESSGTFKPPSDCHLAVKAETTWKTVPSKPFSTPGNTYRARRESFGNLPADSPLLVSVPGRGQKLHKLCAARFMAMREAAMKADSKFDFKVASGWRRHRFKNDPDYYCKQMVAKYGSCSEGKKKIAFKSPHETGLAFDLGSPPPFAPSFDHKPAQEKTAAYAWLKENAHKFGITPYKLEPWHWECVITRKGWVTGEEYTKDFNVRVEEKRVDNGKLTTDPSFEK